MKITSNINIHNINIIISYQFDEDSNNISSEVTDVITVSESAMTFKEVIMKSIKNFSVLMNGLIINSELPNMIFAAVRKLVHEHFLRDINCKFGSGIISEIINIADDIRASKINTPVDHFSTWDRTLKAFN